MRFAVIQFPGSNCDQDCIAALNGIEGLRAEPDPSRPVVGTLGTLMPIKGHHDLIRATARLAPEFPEVQLRIGGGPAREFPDYGDELRRLSDQLGVSDRVELLGAYPEPQFLEAVLRGATDAAGDQ